MKAKHRCSDSEGGSASFAAGRAGPGLEDFPKCPLAAMGSAPSRSLLLSLLSLLPAVCGDCGPLPKLSRAEPPEDVRHKDSFPVGSQVTYRCLQNLSKIPSRLDTIKCLNNSLWSNLQEFCDRSCQSPPQVAFAKLSEEDEMKNFYAVGITVSYDCSPGYENSTAELPSSTCRENSTWSEVPELCHKQSCGPPTKPEHGTVEVHTVIKGIFHLLFHLGTWGCLDSASNVSGFSLCNWHYSSDKLNPSFGREGIGEPLHPTTCPHPLCHWSCCAHRLGHQEVQ
ncbi:complement decay-accelerating factor-like isoform X2 [Centrocercus urophasianus]|uniref:complement decay-accelerating factor-like isoform X2 n=1 Tax=Centrocercus urophasianus TaxID=9002 RepID=UPI001C650B9D|nr:complement decay-accelerating factor-like isoform X2 [Centrocercus urophasianus]